MSKPIVFLGPSIPDWAEARAILDADYRPPIARGDIDDLPDDSLVGIIDGVFQSSRSVSPRELSRACERGIEIFGASSMGALRAVEVPAIRGIGLVYRWYASGRIMRDDEVALVFDPATYRPLSVPLVNVRYAVDRLVQSGSLDAEAGRRIVATAQALPFQERTYRRILSGAGGGAPIDDALLAALQSFDLKRQDAFALIDELGRAQHEPRTRPSAPRKGRTARADAVGEFQDVRLADRYDSTARVHIWEAGARVALAELWDFLKITGRYHDVAFRALAHYCIDGNELDSLASSVEKRTAQAFYEERIAQWGWMSNEERRVTLSDLGIGLDDLKERVAEVVRARAIVENLGRDPSEELHRAMRVGLFLDGLSLKRETMRARSLARLAGECHELPGPTHVSGAKAKICAKLGVHTWEQAEGELKRWGMGKLRRDEMLDQVARGRRAMDAIARRPGRPRDRVMPDEEAQRRLPLTGSPKATQRFVLAHEDALKVCERLHKLAGMTRIAMIGELADLGVHVSQVARPDGEFSSTYGSGKSASRQGAIVGGTMEEIEKWAQEQASKNAEVFYETYEQLLLRSPGVANPAHMALPVDSLYRRDVEIAWTSCVDLMRGKVTYAPFSLMYSNRKVRNDITYSNRAARSLFTSNGLASGFSVAEALTHAVCEVVERHAMHLFERRFSNPGLGDASVSRVDLDTLAHGAKATIDLLQRRGEVFILDATSEIAIPTFVACFAPHDLPRAEGFAAHPDPHIACEMAVLEAAQSLATNVAGGREDLTLKVRSLGRHERPRPRTAYTTRWLYCDPDHPRLDIRDFFGYRSGDSLWELQWVLDRLWDAGFESVLAVDLTQPGMEPARAVRVVIPDLESPLPHHFGRRADATMVADLVGSLPYGAATRERALREIERLYPYGARLELSDNQSANT